MYILNDVFNQGQITSVIIFSHKCYNTTLIQHCLIGISSKVYSQGENQIWSNGNPRK